MADAILLLARRPEVRREMGENGRRKVWSRFNWDKKIDAILEIYRASAGNGISR